MQNINFSLCHLSCEMLQHHKNAISHEHECESIVFGALNSLEMLKDEKKISQSGSF